ncbi:MAG: STAS/SEC14 domain-containing protein [Desulfuromonadales bacterium]
MYERLNRTADNAVAYRITRPLNQEQMRTITSEIEGTIAACGRLRMLIDLQAFPYADLKSFWEELKFDVKFAKNLERFALVGGGEVEKWGTMIFGTLTFTKCRCFKAGQLDEAWAWLTEG